jgi:tRNA-modifying protein YgfZ
MNFPQTHTQPAQIALESGFFSIIDDQGLIAATGQDAASFLHNQLSNDVEKLNPTQARLAAYCNAKGRMQASFLLWKTRDDILLQIDRSLQSKIQKRLQMFILRSKVILTDANEKQLIIGLGGAAASAALVNWFPELPSATYQKLDSEHGSLIRISDANGHPRFEWITFHDAASKIIPALTQSLTQLDSSAWRLSQIQAGIPNITEATYEQFVPQMVNFEVIGGVNFKKGCYPGQEIVARSQYLGKLKRRMSIASIAAVDIKAGTEVFAPDDATQPCGMVVNAERNSETTSLVLVELKLAEQEAGKLHLGSATGAALQLLPLPYELFDVTQ